MKNTKLLIMAVMALGILSASFVFAQTDASVTPLTPGWGGPNYDQPLWTITYNKAIIPVSFTSYHCTSAALVLEYATWADYTKLDWQTGSTGKYTGFIPASASDLSQKVYITIPNLNPSTSYIFRVGAKCTSSSPMGTLAYTTSANQFNTPAAPPPADTTPPDVPFNLTISDVTSTHASLGWSFRSDDPGIARWELKYKTSGGPILDGDWASASSLSMTQSSSPLTVGGTVGFGYNEFTPSTTYMFWLKAYDVAGNASQLAVFPSFTTLAPPPVTIPVAPTELTATYSTANLGQREVVLTVKDNATNETYYQLYWHLSGTTWPNAAPNETYNSSTWSQPANVGRIQIFAPSVGGTYEYQLQACNSAGCSSSNIAFVNVPGTTTPTPLPTPILPTTCTSLDFKLLDNKTSYNVGDNVNYSYICLPAGTIATSVTIQLVKPDGTATTYNSASGGNLGSVLQQMGFSTSNLFNGSHILRACLNDTSCGAGSIYSLPFTVVGGTTTPAPAPNPNQNSTPTTILTPTPTPNPISTPSTTPNTNPNSTPSAVTSIPVISTPNPNPTFIITPPLTPQQSQPSIPALLGSKCTRYLNAIKSSLNSNERTIKNIKQKTRSAPENYVNFDAVTALLLNTDVALADARNLIKNKECSEQMLESIRDKQSDISNALRDLSGYDNDEFQYFTAYAQCKSTLANRTKKINALIKKERNKETKSSLKDTVSEIAQKSQGFAQDASSAYFPEVISQCKDYIEELDDDINFYIRTGKF